MPTIAGYFERYRELSKTASEIARQLNFAGLGVIWIFRTGLETAPAKLPSELLTPIVFIVMSLILDLLQYFVGGLIWRFYAHHLERLEQKAKDNKTPIEAGRNYGNSKVLPAVIEGFLYAKLLMLGIAYFFIGSYLIEHLFP